MRPKDKSPRPAETDSEQIRSSPPAGLSCVGAALRLLKAFSAEDPELGITELAKRLGLAKSTVHRLTSTLVVGGFLERNLPNDRYRLG